MQGIGAGSDNEDCLEFSDIRDFEFEDSLRSVACGGQDNRDRDRSECVPLSPVPHPYACQPQPLYPSSSCCRMSDVCSVPGPFATAPDLPDGIVMDSSSSDGGAGAGAAAAAVADGVSKTELRTLQRAVYGLWFATIVLAAIVVLLTFFPSMVHLGGGDDGAGAGAGLTVKDAKSQAVALAKMLAAVEDAQHRAESLLDELQAAAARAASREELKALREGLLPQIAANTDAEGMLEQSLSGVLDRLSTLARQVLALEETATELRARANTTAQAADATAAAQEENARRIALLEGSVPVPSPLTTPLTTPGPGVTSGGDALAVVERKLETGLQQLRAEADAERGKLAATQADVRRVNATSHEGVGKLRTEVASLAKAVAAVQSSVDELRSGSGSAPSQAGQATASPGAAATTTGLESDVGRLQERVGALETLSTTVAGDVADAHATLAQVQHVVDNLRTDEVLESLRTDVESAQSSIGGAEQSIRDLDSAFQTHVTAADEALAAVRSDAATTQTNLTATNGAVAALKAASDAALQALQTDVAAAQSSIAGAEGDIQGLEARMTGVEAALGKLDADSAATQGNVTALEGDVRELDAAVEAGTAEVDKALQKLQTEAAATEESVRTLNDTTGLALGQLRTDVQVAQDNLTAAADSIRGLDNRLQAHAAATNLTLGSLQANATAAEQDFGVLDSAFQTHVTAADEALAAVRSDASTTQTNLTATNGAIAALKAASDAALEALQTDVAAAQSSIAGAEGDIQGLEARTVRINTTLGTLEGDVAAAQSGIEAAEGRIQGLEMRQGNLTSAQVAIQAHGTTVDGALNTLQTGIDDLRISVGDVGKTASDAQTVARNLFSNDIMPLGGRVSSAETTIKELQTAVSGHADVQTQIDYTLSELSGLENALHLVKHSTAHVTWGEELRLAVNELRGKLTSASTTSEASMALLAEEVAKQSRPPETLLRLGDVKMAVEANGLVVNWEHAGVPFPIAAAPADARYHIKGWVSRSGVVFEATFGPGVQYGVRCSVVHLATLACVARRGVWYTGAATLGLTHGVFEVTVEVNSRGITLAGDTFQERRYDRTYVPSYVTSSARAEGVMEYAGRWASPADVPSNQLYQFTESLVTYNGMPMIPGHTVGNVYSGATYKGDNYFNLYVAAARHRRIPNVGQLWNGNSQLAVPSVSGPFLVCQISNGESEDKARYLSVSSHAHTHTERCLPSDDA